MQSVSDLQWVMDLCHYIKAVQCELLQFDTIVTTTTTTTTTTTIIAGALQCCYACGRNQLLV